MVRIILSREELSMVLGWIGSAKVRTEETRVPWDEFEEKILQKFRSAMQSYKDQRLRNVK